MISERLVRQALDEHGDDLAKFHNVVGLCVVNDESPKASKGDCALAVYVAHKVPEAELAQGDRVPAEVEIHYGGKSIRVPITVIESGEFSFESKGLE